MEDNCVEHPHSESGTKLNGSEKQTDLDDIPNTTEDNFKVPVLPVPTITSTEANLVPCKDVLENKPDAKQAEEKTKSVNVVFSLSDLKSRALSRMSPAELLKESNVSSVTYREPLWSGLLAEDYWVETIKNGVVIEKFWLDKPMASIGRSKHVDIVLEHPSISRVHAVFQMRPTLGESGDEEPGLYLYDCGSTHGTFLNKQRIEANCYSRVKVGHVIKFGNSTRLFIVHGPDSDTPAASPYSITEIKQRNAEMKRRQQELIEERKKQIEKEKESGISWGFKEDAEQSDEDDDENPKAVNPFSVPEELNLEDPKKTLKGCFEREGFELEYICEEEQFGTHICKIELPMVDSEDGRPVFAEVVNKGKRRDVQVQCALEACRILDAHGILRASSHERHEVKKRNWAENDFYDSDDDTYLDRTGSVEAKRKRRMERLGAEEGEGEGHNKVHTDESLTADLLAAQEELSKLEQRIKSSQSHVAKMTSLDTLDEYMQGMKSGEEIDATTRRKMKMRTIELKKEIAKIEKMKKAAEPADIKLRNNTTGASQKNKYLRATSRFGFSLPAKKMSVNTNPFGNSQENNSEANPLLAGARKNAINADESCVVKEGEDGVEYEEDEDESSTTTTTTKLQNATESNIKTTSKSTAEKPGITTQPDQSKVAITLTSNAAKSKATSSAFKTQENSNVDSTSASTTANILKNLSEKREKSDHSNGISAESKSRTDKTNEPRQHNVNEIRSKELISKPKKREKEEALEEGDDFSGWVPPSDQKGDGKTNLNDLLGY